jgi:hypothetical protein
MIQGIVKIKNVSGSDYAVAEIGGHVLADQEVIDLLDTSLPEFYDDWDVVKALVTEENTSQLYQDILLGEVEVVELREPVGR